MSTIGPTDTEAPGQPRSLAEVERAGDVAVLRWRAGENRFRPETLAALESALAGVESAEGPGALVVTGDGRFFSNGLDLEWMGSAPQGGAGEVLRRVHLLLARLLAFPTVTVAAVNGHAFAAGAMLALACDFRVMRADRGFLCLPEVDLGLPFTAGMTALLRAKLSPSAATRLIVYGQRCGGAEAVAAGMADHAVAEDRVLPAAIEQAAALAAKPRPAVRAIKRELYAEALSALAAESGEGAGGAFR